MCRPRPPRRATPATTSPARAGGLVPTVYRNPVSRAVGDTYADPDVVRGKDGWWYAYATSDPLRSGETTRHYIPMSRSRDLVHWTYAGDAFSPAKLPSWADQRPTTRRALGARRPLRGRPVADVLRRDPDERRRPRGGRTTTRSAWRPPPRRSGRGRTAAPRSSGPRPATPPIERLALDVRPRRRRDADGSEHIFYGSYYGGIFEQSLDRSGRHVAGDEKRIAIDNKFEGTYIKRKARLLVPVRLDRQLLRRPDHRVQRRGRPLARR